MKQTILYYEWLASPNYFRLQNKLCWEHSATSWYAVMKSANPFLINECWETNCRSPKNVLKMKLKHPTPTVSQGSQLEHSWCNKIRTLEGKHTLHKCTSFKSQTLHFKVSDTSAEFLLCIPTEVRSRVTAEHLSAKWKIFCVPWPKDRRASGALQEILMFRCSSDDSSNLANHGDI